MSFQLSFSEEAKQDIDTLIANPALLKRLKAVYKALGYLQTNPRHPGLKTHKYTAISGANGEVIFEVYAENNTSGAYKIFWYYGPGKNIITIIAIKPHP